MFRPAPTGGRRGKQLRTVVRAARSRRPSVGDRDGDQTVLALVEAPYSDPAEADRRLHELLSTFERRDDRRAVFLAIYAGMTRAVRRRVERGDFVDPDWVGRYLVAFANRYREAVRAYEAGELASLADPWQVAFEAADEGDALVVQDAALGVNAHINYDLALSLDRVAVDPDRESKYEDHRAVTEVIGRRVDAAQDSLAERGADGVATLDESLGRLDERLTVFTIDECRASAWRTAVALQSRFRPRRRLARWLNDVTATGAASLILASRASDRVHETLRELEGSSGADE